MAESMPTTSDAVPLIGIVVAKKSKQMFRFIRWDTFLWISIARNVSLYAFSFSLFILSFQFSITRSKEGERHNLITIQRTDVLYMKLWRSTTLAINVILVCVVFYFCTENNSIESIQNQTRQNYTSNLYQLYINTCRAKHLLFEHSFLIHENRVKRYAFHTVQLILKNYIFDTIEDRKIKFWIKSWDRKWRLEILTINQKLQTNDSFYSKTLLKSSFIYLIFLMKYLY